MCERIRREDKGKEKLDPDEAAALRDAGEEAKRELSEAADRLMNESAWLRRRRPILGRLIELAAGGDASDATQFRALNLILELMEKAENETRGTVQPTRESVRAAIETLERYGY